MLRKRLFGNRLLLLTNIVALAGIVFLSVCAAEFLTGASTPPQVWTAPSGAVQAMAKDSLAHGKIVVYVGTSRPFGYRIGDIVPVQITFVADKNVRFDFSGIESKTLTTDAEPDFEMADKPTITRFEKDGKIVYQVDLRLRSFVNADVLRLTVDYSYATRVFADGTRDWTTATTPEIAVTGSPTLEKHDNQLLPGSSAFESDHTPLAGWPLLTAGALLSLIFWIGLGLWLKRRLFPPRIIPANEVAWAIFDAAIAAANEKGWHEEHYRQIAAALRAYLEVEPSTRQEVGVVLADHPKHKIIQSVLSKCEGVLYASSPPLSESENRGLIAQLETIVPKGRS